MIVHIGSNLTERATVAKPVLLARLEIKSTQEHVRFEPLEG